MIKQAGMELAQDRAPFAVTHNQRIINEYTAYLFGAIEDSNDFLSVIEVLNAAQADDIVRINLSSVGGSLSATDTLLYEISRAQERGVEVGITGTGLIASAGSLILLAGTYFELSEDACVMLHCGSLGDGGTLAEFRSASAFHIKHMENIFRKHYRLFLTEEEIEQLLDGRDFWLTSQEFCERFTKRNELLQKELEEMLEEQEEEPPIPVARKPRRKKTGETVNDQTS